MIAGTKDERRPVKPQSARFRGVPSDSSRLTSLLSPPNLHADAILFRNRSGNPYRQDTLADDFGTLREAIFPGEKRRLMDMRRSGTLEAIAGGAEGFARRVGEDQPDPLPSQIPSCRITAAGSSGTTRRAGPRSCDPRTQERIALKELLVGFPCEGVSSRPSI